MMNEYINRELALSHPFANGQYDKKHANEHFIIGFESYKEWLEDCSTIEIPKEDEYLLKMLDCKRLNEEEGHYMADKILCDLLNKLGYHKVVNAFEKLHKWYS